jgi:hypothetical protein
MDVMPQIVMPQTAVVQTVVAPQTKKKKPTFKNIMAELLKPPPKDETKPNINLGGGHFPKLDKI